MTGFKGLFWLVRETLERRRILSGSTLFSRTLSRFFLSGLAVAVFTVSLLADVELFKEPLGLIPSLLHIKLVSVGKEATAAENWPLISLNSSLNFLILSYLTSRWLDPASGITLLMSSILSSYFYLNVLIYANLEE